MNRPAQRYADPYLAGIGLGLVLLAAFVVAGRGLGASGAFGSAAAGLVAAIAPDRAHANPYFSQYLGGVDWLVFEILGVFIGGFASAWLAGRVKLEIERGPRASTSGRLACAFGGGALMGTGAVLARGCTSGLALTGGALLSVGSWIFIGAAFAAAYLIAPVMRKEWR